MCTTPASSARPWTRPPPRPGTPPTTTASTRRTRTAWCSNRAPAPTARPGSRNTPWPRSTARSSDVTGTTIVATGSAPWTRNGSRTTRSTWRARKPVAEVDAGDRRRPHRGHRRDGGRAGWSAHAGGVPGGAELVGAVGLRGGPAPRFEAEAGGEEAVREGRAIRRGGPGPHRVEGGRG